MTIRHFAGLSFWIVIASAAASGQQPDSSVGAGPQAAAETTVIRTYSSATVFPTRRVETRRVSGDREIRTETVETLDVEGRLAPSEETVTETNGGSPDVVRTRRDVFGHVAPGQRSLLATSESDREI